MSITFSKRSIRLIPFAVLIALLLLFGRSATATAASAFTVTQNISGQKFVIGYDDNGNVDFIIDDSHGYYLSRDNSGSGFTLIAGGHGGEAHGNTISPIPSPAPSEQEEKALLQRLLGIQGIH
ncbi:MAG TPA: hypothetical protein VN207_04660 [Ktedonobacteraceae bacterium]|nr:hypothetical protein [Ktedonobacteraceae bacterium]